jgi:diaminohydroxyphosphoribosylaminopyrimidine deaminase/5-amino-6-(5-phosphoribosylamino)uracil reductase
VLGVGAREAAALNAGYLWSSARPERPFVALKLATSVDGLIADADGRSQWISGSEARDWVQWLRAGFDAIAVGRHTAVRDDPRLTVRGAVAPRVPPARVVFAGRGTIPATLQCLAVDDARVFVVAHPERVPVLTRDLAATAARVLPAATLADGLRALRAEDVRSVLVEGGGVLAGGLLDERLVDRFYRITAPRWLGQGTPAFGTRRAMPLDSAPPWEVVERRILGTDDLTVYDRELCLQGL